MKGGGILWFFGGKWGPECHCRSKTEGKPKAYLNFVLFDDQFTLMDENSGVRQVKGE